MKQSDDDDDGGYQIINCGQSQFVKQRQTKRNYLPTNTPAAMENRLEMICRGRGGVKPCLVLKQ